MKKTICVFLCVLTIAGILAGCAGNIPTTTTVIPTSTDPRGNEPATPVSAVDLMQGITPGDADSKPADEQFCANQVRFALNLLRETIKANDRQNTLISPLSVQLALAMTANGADGETLKQMEALLGGKMTIQELNAYLHGYVSSLPSEDGSALKPANSIWFLSREEDDFRVNRDFLQLNADYYGAQAYAEPFDQTTLEHINSWVNEKTDGMIDSILDQIPEDAVMYLINALAFDAEWEKPYDAGSVRDGYFTSVDGKLQKVVMLSSEESKHISCGNAQGFIKDYKDGHYGFAVLLPDEGVNVFDYLESLTPDMLAAALKDFDIAQIRAVMPKFEDESSFELSDALCSAGMNLAFGPNADLTKLASSIQKLFLGRVLHKTYISLTEQGTRAGAATAVEVKRESISETDYTITLDRPFVYMIIDNQTSLPLFIGVMADMD